MPTNNVLTPTAILKETYAVMHQESNFLMKTNRQYDNRFANSGLSFGKIGQSLNVRLPAKYVTRTGNTMQTQNYVERQLPLALVTIHGVDLSFTQEQLTFSIQDFSERVLRPAVSQLTATIEAYHLANFYKKISRYVGLVTTASTTVFRDFQNNGRKLTEMLAPKSNRTMTLDPQTRVDFSDAVKGLFQSSDNIRDQYVEGLVGRTGGYNCFENTLAPAHTSGTFTSAGMAITTSAGFTTPYYDGTGNATPTDPSSPFSLYIDGMSAAAFKAGDVFTITGVKAVHPETKQAYGDDITFTLQEDATYSSTRLELKVLPVPIFGGAYANISRAIADNDVVTFLGPATTAAAITYGQNISFHRDAYAFVTADLEDPSQYGAWGTREVFDNLSIRIWRQGDIVNGNFPCRLDIAHGGAAIYPEWASRWVHAQS
jgi:hypothetical protein